LCEQILFTEKRNRFVFEYLQTFVIIRGGKDDCLRWSLLDTFVP